MTGEGRMEGLGVRAEPPGTNAAGESRCRILFSLRVMAFPCFCLTQRREHGERVGPARDGGRDMEEGK